MPGFFKSARSTVTPFWARDWFSPVKMLVDSVTGAPVGIQSPNANGPDGIWVPIDVTAAQIASPTTEMLADLNATYRLNVAPYTRYRSDGTKLVGEESSRSITAAEVASPTASMLADTQAAYQLTTAPYTRFRSDGEAMLAEDCSNIVPATGLFSNVLAISALHITGSIPQHVRGTLHVRA